jgi:type II secretory pathway pseudopilin PulG
VIGKPVTKRSERGYMLLILMFFVMLLTFSMMAILPRVAQQVKRDREEEMIHRGTEYARAVKKFYKKFNRYPGRIEDLENTNQFRFIRKRYKDPFSKDGNWKLLHITDVQQGISNPNFGMSQAGNFNPSQGNLGQGPGGLGGNAQGTPGGSQGFSLSTPDASQGDASGQPAGGQNPFGGGPGGAGQSAFGGGSAGGQSPFGSGGGSTPLNNLGQQGSSVTTGSSPSLAGQTFGGSGIVGVASVSKAKSIREFNKKSNYNKWMFIYDPTQDRGTLLKGPYNPQAFQGGAGNGANPAQGQSGAAGSVFGPNAGQQPPQQQPQQNAPAPSMPPDMNAPPE